MTKKSANIITTDANQGQKLDIAKGTYRIIVSGKQTGGNFSVIEMVVPPGAGPDPHSHTAIQESFYVLEGEINFKSETGNYIAQKNSFISIPLGGAIHSFKNLTDKPAKLLCTVIPAGLDDFFQEISDYMKASTATPSSEATIDNKEKINSISEKYGQKLYPENYLD